MDTLTNKRFACVLLMAGGAAVAGAQEQTLLEHMHEHYDAVVRIQAAVIAGSLEGTREPAQWLVEHPAPDGLPAEWQVHVEAMRDAARDTLDAQDLASAAYATSRLGAACGGCHEANSVTVEFDSVDSPSYDDDSRSHMQRHQWAADRMWEGLIGPSGWAWSRGGNLLFESPLRHESLDDEQIKMARRIHQLAANATAVSSLDEKAEIYGEFLANCAACHTAMSQGPQR